MKDPGLGRLRQNPDRKRCQRLEKLTEKDAVPGEPGEFAFTFQQLLFAQSEQANRQGGIDKMMLWRLLQSLQVGAHRAASRQPGRG